MASSPSCRSERVVVVTGAAGLIGTEICAAFSEAGWTVCATDLSPELLGSNDAYAADVADPESVAAVAARVAQRYGKVDCLVHAAAVTGRTPGYHGGGDLASLPPAVWSEMLHVNLTGALVCVQSFLELLRSSTAPRILLVGSIQGLVPTIGSGAYAVSKVALGGLTRQLAAELAPEGILVNMVAPGPIADAAEQERLSSTEVVGPTPMRRYGSPAEVAAAICALADSPFSYVTGATIPVDGGEHLRPRRAPARAHPATSQ